MTSVLVMAPVHSRDSQEVGHSLEARHSLEAHHSPEAEGSRRAQVEGHSPAAGHHSQVAGPHSQEVAHTARSVRRSGDLPPAEGLQQSWGGGQPAHSPVADTQPELVGLQEVGAQVRLHWPAAVHRDHNPPWEVAARVAVGSMRHSVKHTDLPLAEAPGGDLHRVVHHKPVAEPADGVPHRGPAEVVHHMESFAGHTQEEPHHRQEEGTWQPRPHQAANAEAHSATQGLPLLLPPNNAEASTAGDHLRSQKDS